MKNEKGITLVALVVTIIVLLILAGVSITMVAGDNGIATKAQKAKKETEEETFLEEIKVYLTEYTVEKNTTDGSLFPEDVVDGLSFIGGGTDDDGEEFEVFKYKDKLVKVYYSENGNILEVDYAEGTEDDYTSEDN